MKNPQRVDVPGRRMHSIVWEINVAYVIFGLLALYVAIQLDSWVAVTEGENTSPDSVNEEVNLSN